MSGRLGPRFPTGDLSFRGRTGRPVVVDAAQYRQLAYAAEDIARELGGQPGSEFAVSARLDEGELVVIVAVRDNDGVTRSRAIHAEPSFTLAA